MDAIFRRLIDPRDPRYYQIAVLGSLLGFGSFFGGLGIKWHISAAIVATAQLVQLLASSYLRLSKFDPLSALITSLSLTLLLRTGDWVIAILAAAIAIGSKFLIRVRGKHLFNPANFALVALIFSTDNAWVSSGQWGSDAVGALALACLGFIVLTRARRAETTIAFLCTYSALLIGRALWLGDPLGIPLHQLQNGALLIFAFFMVSDPKTTPDTAPGRLGYGAIVAAVAYAIQFVLYEPNGPILALFVSAPLVPLVDLLAGGSRYRWDKPTASIGRAAKGVH
jgi:Na+-transporting NADH:ubiquinone oxidoreductase subunit NqrB